MYSMPTLLSREILLTWCEPNWGVKAATRGRFMYNPIHFRDYPVILAGILLFSLVFVLVNLGVDVLDAFPDLRIGDG